MDFTGRKILILGLAREGASLARYLAQCGARVTVTDAAPQSELQDRIRLVGASSVRYVTGGHHPELVSDIDELFVSPGVPETNPVYAAARERGMSPRSMTTLFFELCAGPIVGITGSSGKTTTTGLIGSILRHADIPSVVGGNIGDPMLDLLPTICADTVAVLELSSFQLSILQRSPHVAVVTNISPNHLDRHGTMEDYVAAKRQLVAAQNAQDYAVLNADDLTAAAFAAATPACIRHFGFSGRFDDGATVREGQVGVLSGGRFSAVIPVQDIPLLGRHNAENVMAALAATAIYDVSPQMAAEAVRSYRPSPHRLETVGCRDGVRFIDDSIATSPVRASVALDAIDAPVVLIAGGRDKHLPWDDFARRIVDKARGVCLIGEAASLISGAIDRALHESPGMLERKRVVRCDSLEEAVHHASTMARPGDVVLLAPGCASYDMFRDFEERGRRFARAVEAVDAA